MTISHLLENFTPSNGRAQLHVMSDNSLEDLRLSAFEKGYSAGWEDAVQAQNQNQDHISESLSQTLKDLDFTYQEVLAKIGVNLAPFFSSLAERILPTMMSETTGQNIVECLLTSAQDQLDQKFEICVATQDRIAVEAALSNYPEVTVDVIPDASLEPGEAHLNIGESEHEFDANRVLATLQALLRPLSEPAERDISHG